MIEFPPISKADSSGLLAIGGNLDITTLERAYTTGIFPWPYSDEFPLVWYSPDPRGILEYKNLHIPRSLKKMMRKEGENISVSFNQDFKKVITECSKTFNRKGQWNTWLTTSMINAYTILFENQKAMSVEIWQHSNSSDRSEKILIAGLYGVSFGGFFSGESMFFRKANTSKFALLAIILELQKFCVNWIDTQMVTSVIQSLGANYIPRNKFLEKLAFAKKQELDLFNYFSKRTFFISEMLSQL